MFDVSKIKLGDYVETRDGRIGYVVENKWSIGENRFAVQFNNGDIYSFSSDIAINKYFKQIGAYKFNKEEKKEKHKIKPLEIEVKYETKKCDKITTFANGETTIDFGKTAEIITGIKDIPNYEVYAKINEIIDYLNQE